MSVATYIVIYSKLYRNKQILKMSTYCPVCEVIPVYLLLFNMSKIVFLPVAHRSRNTSNGEGGGDIDKFLARIDF